MMHYPAPSIMSCVYIFTQVYFHLHSIIVTLCRQSCKLRLMYGANFHIVGQVRSCHVVHMVVSMLLEEKKDLLCVKHVGKPIPTITPNTITPSVVLRM